MKFMRMASDGNFSDPLKISVGELYHGACCQTATRTQRFFLDLTFDD